MLIGLYRRLSRAFRDVIAIAHNCTNPGVSRILEGFPDFRRECLKVGYTLGLSYKRLGAFCIFAKLRRHRKFWSFEISSSFESPLASS